jgi:hypothetical protein
MSVANEAIEKKSKTIHLGDLSSPVAPNSCAFWLFVREFFSATYVTNKVHENKSAMARLFVIRTFTL